MLSVEADLDYYLTYPVGEVIINSEIRNLAVDYDRLYPINDKQYVKKVRAKELWDRLIQCAHNTAEPGILFIDRIHDYSPDGNYDDAKAISTNPCGEIPLGPYDSCRLMHINFTSFVKDAFTKDAHI